MSVSQCTVFLFCLLVSFCESENSLQVTVSQGVLQGVSKISSEGKEFFAFLGVPYAKPPIGELRFEPPEPAVSWSGIREATTAGSDCLQFDPMIWRDIVGKEDCLYLNIFTGKLPSSEYKTKHPVVVFIHGGAFTSGSGSPDVIYGPEFVMNRDVVFVTLNYRVGVLGFLSSGNTLISGNMGLKDQSLALKWIKENIESFGGDSNRITIYGESAGSASVHYQMLSPMSKGLFNGAISVSGTATAKWAVMSKALTMKRAKFIANFVDCPTDFGEESVKCLKEVDAEDLIEGVKQIKDHNWEVFVSFSATVEPKGSKNIFLSEDPSEILRKGTINDVPWLTGYTSNEGLTFALGNTINPSALAVYYTDPKIWLGISCELYDRVNNLLHVVERAKEYYYGDKEITTDNIKGVSAMMSDTAFVHPVYESVQMHLNNKNIRSPVYLFRLSAHPERSSTLIGIVALGRDVSELGVGHGEDISLVFYTKLVPAISSENDLQLSKNFIDMIVNFAATGNPNGVNESVYKPVTPEFHYTDINLKVEERSDFPLQKMKFWDEVFDEDRRSQSKIKEEL